MCISVYTHLDLYIYTYIFMFVSEMFHSLTRPVSCMESIMYLRH